MISAVKYLIGVQTGVQTEFLTENKPAEASLSYCLLTRPAQLANTEASPTL